jgi:RNA polymerase sigma-70 factor (ECF subfamily)
VRRREKEAAAARAASRLDSDRDPNGDGWPGDAVRESLPDDELGLIFLCCHPSLDPAVRVALTLRSVCGLGTDEIAAAFLVPEPTMAQRLVRAKRKIRQARISFGIPGPDDLAARLDSVLRVVYLVFTQGHMAAGGQELVKGGLCDQAVRLARALAALMPQEPEAAGLLALLLLTDARRGARSRDTGDIILLEDQDRGRWDRAKIAEGEALLEQALRAGLPGPYQLHAAIAACHSCAPAAADTDWREIAALYGELIRFEPTPVVEANRAVAVAMAEGPEAGLVILDAVGGHPQMDRWPQFHIARAELLRRVGRFAEATDAYRAALRLEPAVPEQDFIGQRIRELGDG